jgi:hypothetical protein
MIGADLKREVRVSFTFWDASRPPSDPVPQVFNDYQLKAAAVSL